MLLALAFIAGLAIGFPLGLAAYLSTYALFQKESDSRLRKRVAVVHQQALALGREQAAKLMRVRAINGNDLNSPDEISEEVEEALIGRRG